MEQLNNPDHLEKKVLQEMCHIAKCIYNFSLYHQRKFYKDSGGKYLNKKKLDPLVRKLNPKLYYKLNSWVAQASVYKVDRDYQSFFKHLKVAKPDEVVKPPYYREKGLKVLDFAGPALKVTKDTVRLSLSKYLRNRYGMRFLTFQIPFFVKGKEILEVSLIPKGYGSFDLKYVYEYSNKAVLIKDIEKEKALAIDFGVNNIAACVSTEGDAFLFGGKWVKSINQFFNKRAAKLQSSIETETHPMEKLKLLEKKFRLAKKRNRTIKDVLHKISFNIVNYCKEKGITKIVLGHNVGWKDEVNLGGRTNQNFVQIPHSKLMAFISYKAER